MFQTLELICLQPGEDPYMELGISIIMMPVIMIKITALKMIKAATYQACHVGESAHEKLYSVQTPSPTLGLAP